jgi:hypothetical protein
MIKAHGTHWGAVLLLVMVAKPGLVLQVVEVLHLLEWNVGPVLFVCFITTTKYGVDILDTVERQNSAKVSSRSWPVHTFYNIIDMAPINSVVIYRSITKSKISRRNANRKLAGDLREESIRTGL